VAQTHALLAQIATARELGVIQQAGIDAFSAANGPQTDEGAGALPDPLSPGSGVATSPPAPSSQPVEEPTGDVWVSLDGKWPLFHRQPDGESDAGHWTNHDGYEMPWAELLANFGTKEVVVYRREVSCETGENPEVLRIGVGEVGPLADDDMTAEEFDRRMEAAEPVDVTVSLARTHKMTFDYGADAYRTGCADTIDRLQKRLIQLRSSAITAERQDAYDKAIEAVEALS
jgi:hypothetical protein